LLGLLRFPVYSSLTEVAPMGGDDEQHTCSGKRDAGDNRSRFLELQGGDLGGGQPNAGEDDQQEPHLSETDTGRSSQCKFMDHGPDSSPVGSEGGGKSPYPSKSLSLALPADRARRLGS
jgi:hypothetical protein